MQDKHLAVAAAAAIALGLTACGGGGGNVTALTTQGVITGFGSVFVNGVEYDTTGTSVTVNGTPEQNDSNLKVGMVVTLKGSENAGGKTGTATSITYADDMRGVVTANNVTNGIGTLTVMGQTVTLNASTVFESSVSTITTPDQIAVGNIVEVSGYASSGGTVTATLIEVKAQSQAGSEIEVKGVVSNLNTTAQTFTLGSLTVDYSGLAPTSLPAKGLAAGQYVEVKSTTAFDGTGPLLASQVELADNGVEGHQGSEGEDVNIAGLVTAGVGANNQFQVNGKTIAVNNGTQYENGAQANLVTGAKVEVEGSYDANGNLVATKIQFSHEADAELAGLVEAVDATAGTITVMGDVLHIDSSTLMVDDSSAQVRYFHLSNISATDYVEVEAYKDPTTGNLIATKLKREETGSTSTAGSVHGVVSSAASSTWVVAGVKVDVSAVATLPTVTIGTTKLEISGTYDTAAGVLHATAVTVDD